MTLTTKQTLELMRSLEEHDLESYADRIRNAIDRDRRGGSPIPDGHKPNRGYDGGRGGGNPGDVELTLVERMADGRVNGHHRDPHHERTDAIVTQTRRAIAVLDRLSGLLAGIDNLAGTEHQEPGCRSCERVKDHDGRPWQSVRFRGDLCRWCYGWVNDQESNPTRALPPLELLEKHRRGERITTSSVATALARGRRTRAHA